MPRPLTFVVTLAALMSLAIPAAAAPALSDAGAKAMVLSPSDLPSTYSLDDGHYVTNAELNGKDPAWKDYTQLGRITGYNAFYTTIRVSAGMTEVDAFASVYKTGVGAHNSLMLTLVQAHERAGTTRLSAPAGLLGGDALVYRMKASSSKVDLFTVAWRRGSVFAEVIGGGLSGTISLADVLELAKKQDSRIVRALKNA